MKYYYTYMVECSDGSYYTGYTTDLEKRVASHNAGAGAKCTKSRRPVRLIYSEKYETKHDAMSREMKIKQLTHQEKAALIYEGAFSRDIKNIQADETYEKSRNIVV